MFGGFGQSNQSSGSLFQSGTTSTPSFNFSQSSQPASFGASSQSLFGGSGSTSLFGASQTGFSFGGNTGSSSGFNFGGANASQPSLLGQNTVNTSQSNLFGQGTGGASQPNLFGYGTGSVTQPSLFGQSAGNASQPSLFGQSASNANTSQPSLFDQSSSSANLFGTGNQVSSSAFGGGIVFGSQAQPQEQQTQSLFGGNRSAFDNSGGSIFGQSSSQPQTSVTFGVGQTGFGATTTTASQSTFGFSFAGQQTFPSQSGPPAAPTFGTGTSFTPAPASTSGGAFGAISQPTSTTSFGFGQTMPAFGAFGTSTGASQFEASTSAPVSNAPTFGTFNFNNPSSSGADAVTSASQALSVGLSSPPVLFGQSTPSSPLFGQSSPQSSLFGTIPSTSSTPLFGVSTASTPSSAPLFGSSVPTTTTTSVTPSSKPTISAPLFGSSTAATTNTQVTTTTTSTAQQQQQQSLPSTSEAPSDVKGKMVEQIINEWNKELDQLSKDFVKYSAALVNWDTHVFSRRQGTLELYQEVSRVINQQMIIESKLKLIETQQQELHNSLGAIENEAENMYQQELSSADIYMQEREELYSRAEKVNGALLGIRDQIREVVSEVNAGMGANLKGAEKTPVNSIVRILNNQMLALQNLEKKVSEITVDVDRLEKVG